MTQQPYHQTKTALAHLGGQRVWSLMVTLFGDLAQSEGDTIKGPVLSAILAEMDIRPEAVRVALHRLRNDGWISSVKQGRTSRHSLTKLGRAQSAAASPRIYAMPGETPKGWQIAMLEDPSAKSPEEMLGLGYAPLMSRLYIGSTAAAPVAGAVMLQGSQLPKWMPTQFEPQILARDYAALRDVLSDAARNIPSQTALSPLQTAVIRCLIVHNWRRLVLKHPDLPRCLYTDSWAGERCHVLVHDLLDRFKRPPFEDILID